MLDRCILAIDQGTTSSRAIVFSADSQIVSVAQQEFAQIYPQSGWVEHDPEAIWHSTLQVCQQSLQQANNAGAEVTAIGITNQRETTVVWNRRTGKAIYNAIVWQDRRTAAQCRAIRDAGHLESVTRKTGLLLDPYFSASKIGWILNNVPGARTQAENGELAFGTVDSFLIWRLTQGELHATDVTNASRTSLFNIHDLCWDDELLALFDIPAAMLPTVKECADDFGTASAELLGQALPIAGVAGDQQAAAIGQCCFNSGDIKSTYGTGCFVLSNTGATAKQSGNQLLTTLAYKINGQTSYALEGSIFVAGAGVQWLRDGIKCIQNAEQTQQLAESLPDDHGVYLVPAFAGLGAPHWHPDARGAVFGLTRGSNEAHLARAALESVCYQTCDLLSAMQQDGVSAQQIRVDGGMAANDWLCQFLANCLNINVARPRVMETTALGAAYLAGLQHGVYDSLQQLRKLNQIEQQYQAHMPTATRETLLAGWHQAVKATLLFGSGQP